MGARQRRMGVPARSALAVGAVVMSALGAVALLTVPGTMSLPTAVPVPSTQGIAAGDNDGLAFAPPAVAGDLVPDDSNLRRAQIVQLLRDRGAAVAHADFRGYTTTQLPGVLGSAPLVARLRVLPITAWQYSVDGITTGIDSDQATVSATLRYRLDIDRQDVSVPVTLTLTKSANRWFVTGEKSRGSRRQIWEVGDLSVVRGNRSLIIGVGSPAPTTSVLRQWAAVTDAAVDGVAQVIATGWQRRAVVVVPSTASLLAKLLGRNPDGLSRIAAVTTAELGEAAQDSGVRGADRVWLNVGLMASLSNVGRRIVVQHELSHVATGAAATRATPLWLEEGIAEYIGYRSSGVSLSTAARDLVENIRAGNEVGTLPQPADFAGPNLAIAYEKAHVACNFLAREYGEAGLLRIY